jgi:DNA-binding NarL/FixJ family response regulator
VKSTEVHTEAEPNDFGGHPSQKQIRVLIADDHEFVRLGLRELLEAGQGFAVCGEASDGRQAFEQAERLKPDVVVLDISMPGLNGLETTRQIVRKLSQTKVLVFTVHESEELAVSLLKAGAHGYLLKSDAGRDLLTAVESVHQCRPFFTPKVGRMVLEGYLKGGCEAGCLSPGSLTSREREVLQLVAEGKSNKEVATVQAISVKTAETHRANLMRKLGLHSISELVRYAVRNQIIAV